MGIREKINQNPMIAAGVAGVGILIAFIFIGYQIKGMACAPTSELNPQAWYTAEQDKETFTKADEGKLFFADSVKKIPPFAKDGKDVVRVQLYTVDNGKTFIVGLLERYTPEAKAAMEKAAARKGPPSPDEQPIGEIQMFGVEIKRPGKQWVKRSQEQEWEKTQQVELPAGAVYYQPPK